MSRVRRVYSETLPYRDVVRPRTLDLLSRRGLELVLAVRPWDLELLPDVARALAGAQIPLSIWPMLSDEQGRWCSVHNAAPFGDFVLSICDRLDASGQKAREVLFDLEPPFAQARSLATLAADGPRSDGSAVTTTLSRWLDSAAYRQGAQALARAAAELAARDIATSMAVWPLVALDPPGSGGWQGLLGTPVDALGAEHVSVMMYTSIVEGWSRGALRRPHATALLARATVRTVERWGNKAGLSLGCVGTGAFADEPIYRSPSELAEDAAIACAAGCQKLTLFDLGGVLAREPAEAWLDAFVGEDPAAAPGSSHRVRAARLIARAMTWALQWA